MTSTRQTLMALAILLTVIAGFLAPLSAPAQAPVLTHQWNLTNYQLSLSLPANSAYYYNLQRSTNLFLTAPASAAIGRDPFAVTLTVPLMPPVGFFRAELISIFAPQDTDGDGIDDLYELDHPAILDPLNPADAGLPDPDGSGLTRLQKYRLLFGFEAKPPQAFSREVTGFNFGAPSARLEAVTREISTFNFGAAAAAYEAHAREVSIYAGESPAQTFILQAYSREFSAFNFGADGAIASREVSVFAGETPSPTFLLQVYSREVSAFNFGAPSANYEAISREVSAQNFFVPQ